ncbi:class I SAM-dependent DNA methyltransferase [Parafilimonas terrae]|uniref:Methyltransferase domain-containing protein n=1 Tax=Parafilimonas terrae TaxID=1465490 RepID=A0A1I5TF61_9BACT|nr:class I SAM-dependent methyltransferase [Parafilimonas terrae]SFP81684.1 Methyltransferase domain-containing protein [Parafilimonas terrae]
MNVREAYNNWAAQYDTGLNKTRDLEAVSLRQTLSNIDFTSCLEVGCGTGKNTEWLAAKAEDILAIDLSEEMLNKARNKTYKGKVSFLQFDINGIWNFTNRQFDIGVFSLVLEHIKDIDSVFNKVSEKIKPGGYLYIGELHPFKQYTGSKAKFETDKGTQLVTCFMHHLSDFIKAADKNGFQVILIDELFDDNDKTSVPRILTLLFKRK